MFRKKFSFKSVPVNYVESIIKNIPNNKAARGEIPLHILKQCGFTYQMLTDCIIDALSQGIRQFIKKTKLLINKIIGQ